MPQPSCCSGEPLPPQCGERCNEVRRLAWQWRWGPAQRVRRGRGLIEAAGDAAVIDAPETIVNRRRPDAVQPAAAVGVARRGEGASRKLLRVQSVGAALRRVASLRQRAWQGLAREMIAEAAVITRPGAGGCCGIAAHE